MIMENDNKPFPSSEYGVGLLEAPKSLSNSRSTQHYPQDAQFAYRGYIETIKKVGSLEPVFRWLQENRNLWGWMERDIMGREDVGSRQPMRVDYSRRDDENAAVPIIDSHGHSDSDMQFNHDSDDDDDEELDDTHFYGDTKERVSVQGAGLDVVNGIYQRSGTFDGVGTYAKLGHWQDQNHEFSLFRCNTSNNTKHWYISIVPIGVQPGTSTDIDFYSAPVSPDEPDFPPTMGWTRSSEGTDPVPSVTLQTPSTINELENPGVRAWDGSGVHQHYI